MIKSDIVNLVSNATGLTKVEIETVLDGFIESIVSSLEKGEKVEIKARKVHIQSFNITGFKNQDVDFEIHCSKGTYIRSLVNDFGKALNSGAHLLSLRRTKIGAFSVDNALKIEEFIDTIEVD